MITELKNTLEGFNRRLDEGEEQISELEYKTKEITQTEQQNEKQEFLKSGNTLRNLQDNIKWKNICITGSTEGEESKKGPEKLFEKIVAENFPNLWKKQTFKSRNPREFQIR